jgi:Fibronectin type III domain/WD40-like Beta Propeller Repeat
MKKYWMNKLLLAVFLITMVTPVPVQAKTIIDQTGEISLQDAASAELAPIAVGTPVPVMAAGGDAASASAPLQQDVPVSTGSKMATSGGVGVGYYDDPSGDISWTGTWSTLNSGNALGGSYKASTTLNSTASLTFEATQVSLIFAKAPGRGSMEIRIDGNLVTTLAMSNTTEQWQQRWDSPIQADEGPHTILLTHTVTGEVVIDAFEVTNPDPSAPLGQGYYEDTDENILYSGNWTEENDANYSDGSAHYSDTVGDTFSVTFTGNQFSLYYASYINHGIADIYIDDVKIASLNQYSASQEYQKRWQSDILDSNGQHVLTIEHASGAYIDIDAIEIVDIEIPDPVGPGTYENNDTNIVYVGDWTTYNAASASGGSGRYSNTIGNYALLRFTGTQVTLKYTANVNNGNAEIRIDGQLVDTLNQNAGSLSYQQEWASPFLGDEGPHTITITHATGVIIDVDALIVSNPVAPGLGTYEEDNPNIVYTGNWLSWDDTNASGGAIVYTNAPGASASFTFSGRQVTLVYNSYLNRGNIAISIDGGNPVLVNQHSDSLSYQDEWHSSVVAEGIHTVTLSHPGGTHFIDIDALVVSSAESVPPAAVNLTATTGSGLGEVDLSWVSPGDDDNTGTASQYIVRYSINAILTEDDWDTAFDVEGEPIPLAAGTAQSMTVSGLAGQTYYFVLRTLDDSANISALSNSPSAEAEGTTPVGEGTYEDDDENIVYSGTWHSWDDVNASGGSIVYTNEDGASALLTFSGVQVTLVFNSYVNRGNIAVSIDGGAPVMVNQYSSSLSYQDEWTSPMMGSGIHTVTLSHPGGSHYIDIDAVVVIPGEEEPTPTETSTTTVTVTFTPTATPEFDPPDGKEVYRSSYSPDTAGDNPETAASDYDSYGDSISGNGQYTVFSSMASNLIYGTNACETTGFSDVYLHNRQTGTNECLSTMFGAAVDNESVDPFISDTGQFVVFASRASDFAGESAPENVQQIYLLNREGNEIIPVSVNDNEAYADADSYDPYVTSDGQYVIYSSVATNLVTGDTNGVRDVFIRNMGERGPDGSYSGSGQFTIRVSVANDGSELAAGDTGSTGSFLSDDGLIAVFTSDSPDLTDDGTGAITQVFYRDLDVGTTSLVSKNSSNNPGDDDSWAYNLTTEGRFVMFYSDASDLVTGGDSTEDAYVYDIQADVTTIVSLHSTQVIDPFPGVSGGNIAFETTKALINEDTNNRKDVYVRKSDGTTVLVSLPVGAATPGVFASYGPAVSSDGRFVVFTSMVNELDPVDNPPQGGEPNIDNLYIRQIDGRWEGPTAGYYDDDDSNITYTGVWSVDEASGAYGGYVHSSDAINNSATFTFKGRQISLLYTGDVDRGSVEIKINGQVVDTLDQSTPTLQWQRRWNSPVLSNNGPHTLVITHKVSGEVILDALEVSDSEVVGPGIYDDAGGQIQYQGSWADFSSDGAYAETLRYSNDSIATASLKFYGMQVSLIYTKYSNRGDISIQIDDGAPVLLSQYGEEVAYQQRWDSPDLDEGTHTITLSHPGGSHYIDVDALIVTYPAYEMDPPSPIDDLAAMSGDDLGSVKLTWTATGDDFQNGTAIQYIIRYFTTPITTEEIWSRAVDVQGEPVPQIAGSDEEMTVTGLTPGQFYYFAVRARDDGANLSGLGNSPGATSQVDSNAGVGTYEEDNANVVYSGNWTTWDDANASGGALVYTNDPGASATLTFTGRQVKLVFNSYVNRGDVEVSIDGGAPILFSQYSSSLSYLDEWASPILAQDTHTVTFSHPGGSHYIDIDAIVIPEIDPSAPALYQETDPAIGYTGNWSSWSDSNNSGGAMVYTNEDGASAELTYFGRQVKLIYNSYVNRGEIAISIDGGAPVMVNQYGSSLSYLDEWASPVLDEGTHTIILTHPGGTHYIDIDALEVSSPETDTVAPAAVSMTAATGSGTGEVDLSWNAPGDDDNEGTASEYIVRYADSEIVTEDDWNAATNVEGEPLPENAGTAQSMTVSGLTPEQTYYFALRTKDDFGNLSGPSNSPSAAAQAYIPPGAGTYEEDDAIITYSGTWHSWNDANASGGAIVYTNEDGASATMEFSGRQVKLIFNSYVNRGEIAVIIDGGAPVMVDQYSASLSYLDEWASPVMSAGTHTVEFQHPGGDHYVDIDAIKIFE